MPNSPNALFLLSFFYAEVLLCLKVTRTLTVSPLMNCAGETGDSQLSPYYHHPLEYSFRRASNAEFQQKAADRSRLGSANIWICPCKYTHAANVNTAYI